MSEQKGKRSRGKNFSEVEELTLLHLVEVYSAIVNNQKSDAQTWKQKEEAWEAITEKFVSVTGNHRTLRTLKDKYENLKRKSKKYKKSICDRRSTDASDSIQIHSIKSGNDLSNDINGYESVYSNEYETEEIKIEPSIYGDSDEGTIPTLNWDPNALREKLSKKLCFEGDKPKNCLVDEERNLIKLKRNFLEQESRRAAEKHDEELKSLRLKNELLELEILEKKKKLGIC